MAKYRTLRLRETHTTSRHDSTMYIRPYRGCKNHVVPLPLQPRAAATLKLARKISCLGPLPRTYYGTGLTLQSTTRPGNFWERQLPQSSLRMTAQLGGAIIPQCHGTPVACLILEVACRDFHTAPFAARKILRTYRMALHLQTALVVCRCAKLVGAFHTTGTSLRIRDTAVLSSVSQELSVCFVCATNRPSIDVELCSGSCGGP